MKTAMQILISEIKEGLEQDEIKVSPKELLQNLIWRCNGLLDIELAQIENAYNEGQKSEWSESMGLMGDHYYNEIFNNEER